VADENWSREKRRFSIGRDPYVGRLGADVAPANERIPMRYNPDEDRRLTIRLEDDLREVLAVEAQRQMRSLCSEIKFRLRQTLERHQDAATA
jgi:hypothetical protein